MKKFLFLFKETTYYILWKKFLFGKMIKIYNIQMKTSMKNNLFIKCKNQTGKIKKKIFQLHLIIVNFQMLKNINNIAQRNIKNYLMRMYIVMKLLDLTTIVNYILIQIVIQINKVK